MVDVDVDGDTLVDIWGGYRDAARTTRWTEDTLVNVWSNSKCVSTPAEHVDDPSKPASRRSINHKSCIGRICESNR
jgi:hypothetical protein